MHFYAYGILNILLFNPKKSWLMDNLNKNFVELPNFKIIIHNLSYDIVRKKILLGYPYFSKIHAIFHTIKISSSRLMQKLDIYLCLCLSLWEFFWGKLILFNFVIQINLRKLKKIFLNQVGDQEHPCHPQEDIPTTRIQILNKEFSTIFLR